VILALFQMGQQGPYRAAFALDQAMEMETAMETAMGMAMEMEMAMAVEEECYPQVAAQALPLRTGVQ
jgi:hypothetical protein